jgi:hypothetical protein
MASARTDLPNRPAPQQPVGMTKDNELKTGKHVLDKAKPYWDLIAIACFKQTSNEAEISEVAMEADTQYVG